MSDVGDALSLPLQVPTPTSQRLDAGWLEAIVAAAPRFHDADPYSEAKTAGYFKWALEYFVARGAATWALITPELALEWCGAGTRDRDDKAQPPAVSTMTNRQWALRLMFLVAASLGAEVNPYTTAGEPIKRTPPEAKPRPLTDAEDRRVCAYADSGVAPTMGSMAVVLSRAGGAVAELPYVRRRDVDLDAATVVFSGSNARVCPLDEWSTETIARRLRAHLHDPDDLLCVRSNASPKRAAQSVAAQLNKVLTDAGFGDNPEISGRSLRLTAARRAFEVDSNIEDAARVLGARSLDATADAINWRWREEGDPDEPQGRDRHLEPPESSTGERADTNASGTRHDVHDASPALRAVPLIGDGDG